MSKKSGEANVVMAKCGKSHKPYGIRIEERMDNIWYCTWAFKLSEQAAHHEGYGNTMITGRVDLDSKYPGCPYCGAGGWVSCGKCGKLTCYDGEKKRFICSWCGGSGKVQVAEIFDLSGGGF